MQLLILRDPLPVSSPKPPPSASGVPSLLVVALGAPVVVAWLVFGIVPGIGPLDAGDFATASRGLGVPHATGFPLEVMLGHAATWLPWGSAAARVGLVSALATTLALALGGAWLHGVYRTRAAALGGLAVGAIAVASAATLRLHAAVPEVYALQLALVAGSIACAAQAARTRDARWVVMLALVAGLGVANHAVGRLAVPVLLVAAWRAAPAGGRARTAALGVVVGTLAVGAYAYLLVAAQRDPPHNWGDPGTLTRWWRHITGAEIREAFADEMRPSVASMRQYGAVFARQMVDALGVAAPLGALGLAVGALRRRPGFGVAAALLAIDVGYAIAINPMGLRDVQNGQVTAWLLALGTLVLALESASAIAARLPAPGARVAAVRGATLLAVAILVPTLGTPHDDSGRDWATEDVAATALFEPPPDALITTATDSQTAATLYLSVALDARPDAAVFGRHVLSSGEAAARVLPRQPFEIVPREVLAAWRAEGNASVGPRAAEVLGRHVGERPVRWEVAMTTDDLPRGLPFEHRWPYGRPLLPGSAADECAPVDRSYCGAPPLPGYAEAARDGGGGAGPFARRWLATQLAYRGAREVLAGRCDRAMTWFDGAAGLAPEVPNHQTNRAVCLAQLGQLEAALDAALDALRRDPSSATARRNAARYARELGDAALADALEAGAAPPR